MISAKDMFYEERDNETYEDVMNWQNRKPVKKEVSTQTEARERVMELKKKIKELEKEISENLTIYYAFDNNQNLPEKLLKLMEKQFEYPYWYVSKDMQKFTTVFKYKGEWDYGYKLFRNPFFDWDGTSGKSALHSEKLHNRKYNS